MVVDASDSFPFEELPSGWRERVARLVREKRYEEALRLLLEARRLAPDSQEVVRSVQHIKGYLAHKELLRLGGSRRVLHPAAARTPRSVEEHAVLRWVDGRRSLGEILENSPFDELQTLVLLRGLFDPNESGQRQAIGLVTATHAVLAEAGEGEPRESSPAVESAKEAGDLFDRLMAEATEAYLMRDFDRARRLFQRCAELRPQDRRVQFNLKRLSRGHGEQET